MPVEKRVRANCVTCSDATKPREYVDAARGDREIVEPATIALAAVFQDTQPSALGAVSRRQFFKPNDAMGYAVNGLVSGFRGEIVQHKHCRTVAREVMLDGKYLTAIAQRTLGQETYFGETVEDHPRRLDTLHRFENLARGLT